MEMCFDITTNNTSQCPNQLLNMVSLLFLIFAGIEERQDAKNGNEVGSMLGSI